MKANEQPTLIVIGGLPGNGNTTIARELAHQIGAVHLRIDSIEQAMRTSVLGSQLLDDAGYKVAYALAEDNLRLGRTVVADAVNPLQLTRDEWRAAAQRAGARLLEVELKCSDAHEHRRRVEARVSDIPELQLPSWEQVVSREYHPWHREPLVIDTAALTVRQAVGRLRRRLAE